jgi:propanol-preferring alcohol dehydrogenase
MYEEVSQFALVSRHSALQAHVRAYALADANQALDDLRAGRVSGAAVLHC